MRGVSSHSRLSERSSPLTPLQYGGGDASRDLDAMNLRLSLARTVA